MGELEAAVMDVLWSRAGWQTPGEVHAALSQRRALTYNTAMTVLARLWRKGRLDRRRDGRAYGYRPIQSREEYTAARMAELLVGAKDRPLALTHFVAELSPTDQRQLRRTLEDRESEA
jgi:predicted transcriptional regulator